MRAKLVSKYLQISEGQIVPAEESVTAGVEPLFEETEVLGKLVLQKGFPGRALTKSHTKLT